MQDVPGTALLSDLGIAHGHQVRQQMLIYYSSFIDVICQVSIGTALNLKRGTGRHAHVVLVPQPSDDPNDPCVRYSF